MMAIRKVSELKNRTANLRSITPWEDIEINTIYHIPPLITLERKEVMILKKDNDSATYYKIGDKDKIERTMARTSVYARFIVKKRKY